MRVLVKDALNLETSNKLTRPLAEVLDAVVRVFVRRGCVPLREDALDDFERLLNLRGE